MTYMRGSVTSATGSVGRREDLTHKGNVDVGRHGWLRLTPAYSVSLVRDRLGGIDGDATVLDPFSGTGTTPLVAQESGMRCLGIDVNPFLVWLANTKLDTYSEGELSKVRGVSRSIREGLGELPGDESLWFPPIRDIGKWWDPDVLSALSSIRHLIDGHDGKARNLLDVAFCRTLMGTSHASFGHQSMSFEKEEAKDDDTDEFSDTVARFFEDVSYVLSTIPVDEGRTSDVMLGDSTKNIPTEGKRFDVVLTSPPYANRMSYVRELRPYMYWMRYLSDGSDAGELDWGTIGGTWGKASTLVKSWEPSVMTPIDDEISGVCGRIREGKSGDVLSPYVRKYFEDIWVHLTVVTGALGHGAEVCYVVGNSFFSGIEVPTHEWYARMLSALGFHGVGVEVIRKRNSNRGLFEYAVTGRWE